MKLKLLRLVSFALTVAFSLSSMSAFMPAVISAKSTDKTPVLPFSPLSANGMGGTNTEVINNGKLFTETDSVVISADTYLQGIIAEAPPKDTSVSPVMKVTPMVSGSAIKYNYATVTHSFEKTVDLTSEMGLKISTVSGGKYSVADTTVSQAYSNISFEKRNNFVGADGVMFYLKIDAANIVAPNFAAFVPETVGRWKYDFDPVLMLMVGKEYSYRTLNSTSWTKATAVQDKAGSAYFGAMRFDGAFEGYVKIPLESLGNDLGFKFKPNQDSFKLMCIRTKGLGGKYGTVTAGPYFVINKDSTSTNVEVSKASFSAAPANIGTKISGFKEPLKDADALLLYVKTESANRITVSANMWDDYLGDIPSLVLKSGVSVYTASLGANNWIEIKTVKTEADGAVEFNAPFEGYIKVPISSLKEQEASPFIAIYPEIDYITGVEVGVAGIGGKFGKVEVAPFLINEDKGTPVFKLSDEYKLPVAEATEVDPILNTEIQKGNWQTVTHTEVKPLDYTNALASQMTAKAAEGYDNPTVSSSQGYANFKLNDFAINGYEGVIFYVKTEGANMITPQISLAMPADKTRWNKSYNPIMAIKVGNDYEYMPISGNTWQKGTAIADASGSAFFGSVKFDGAFEGYVKIPFSSLDNDSGFIMQKDLDCVANIVYRAKGLGASYGTVTLGCTMFVSKNGSEGIKLKEPDPIVVSPVTEWESNQTAQKSVQTVVTPLDWTDAKGLKISANSVYTNNYPANSLAYARFKTNGEFVLGDATHIIWYIKTDSANTVLPRIGYSGAALNMGYDPEMTLGVGKSYSYLPIGGDKWISATSVPTWSAAGGNTYFGGMKFDGAFEGYIKIAIADLSNDNARVNKSDRATTKISNFIVSVAKIGGQYGTVTAGPIFLTNKNTDSPVIKLYEAPNPNADVAINATPITGVPTVDCKTVTPFRGLTLNGYEVSGNRFGLKTNTPFNNSNGLLIYVKSDKENAITPNINGQFSLNAGSSYKILSFSEAKWTNGVAAADGSVELKAGFEGYIRLPYSAFFDNNGNIPDSKNVTLSSVNFGLKNKNSIILAPISLITNSGEGTEVIYPTSYDSADPYERIQGIFERSKQGLAQGHYYMIGDSTRHLYGYPIFRIVRNALKENYNMNCTVQALSGLKAEHWSDYTPGLDGPLFPTVGQLIEQIPGTGRNCIVDLALAINDSAKSGDKIYEFLMMGINKIRAAKPEAVIVYTSPSLISFAKQNKNIYDAAELVWADKSIYKIDVMKNVFDDYYSQYYVDTHHPNSLGYKLIGQYIVTRYVEGLTFEKIYDVDTNSYTLPTDATPITSTLSVDNTYNLTAGVYSMKVNGVNVSSIKLNGSKVCTSSPPFNTQNYIQTKLSEHLNGNDYIAFYLKLPAANRIGLRAFTMEDNKEIIFKRDMKYYIMPLGGSSWIEKVSGSGRKDDIETYGSLDFDGAFEGWVKLPLSGFYGSPSAYEDVNGVTFRFSELGGEYGEVRLGAFFATSDKPYTAKNVWKKSDLPEMVPFTPITELDSAPWMYRDFLPSPIPTLSTNKALVIGSDPTAEYESPKYAHSIHWVSTAYDNMPLGKFTHLMFYVKAPKSKDNAFILHLETSDGVFQIMANMGIQLLPLGETKWQHYVSERTINSIGGALIPAGFEGFVKISYESLLPSNRIDEDTVLNKIAYRFKYIGMGDDRVIVGPVFGVTKDNDTGPDEIVYTSLPEPTTIKSIYKIEDCDKFVDSVMLYWEAFEGAKYYMAEAYSITKTESGYEYRLVSSNRCVSNSGAITDLMPGRKYAVLIKAYDLRDKLLAIYDYTTFETPETDNYDYALISDKMKFDKVYYVKNTVAVKSNSFVWIAVAGGVGIVLLAGAAVVFAVIFKRRKKNAKEKV